jgi:hypothetical protein
MTNARKMCFDKILPRDSHRPNRFIPMANGRSRAIAIADKRWINGSKIRIGFLDGTQSQIDMVRNIAPQWTRHANLKFEFTDAMDAEIRVTFDASDGAWSYVGTDNLNIPKPQATLNLGWQDEGVILHEFGHMIGLSHEHQNPDQGIQWNEQAVIDELAKAPNFWDEVTVRHNVLDKYSADILHGTEFDSNSIMLYAFPAAWTLNGFSTHENDELSKIDEAFVKSEKMYPSMDPADQRAVPLELGKTLEAEISSAGEEDLYKLILDQSSVCTLQTRGSTDVVMQLYGPDSLTRLIAEDDDGGTGLNSMIEAALQPGEYYVQVKHYSPEAKGAYRILAFS